MLAMEITAFGAPDVLRLGHRPDPVAGAGEVLIRVAASGVNRPDVLQRAGHYPAPAGASDIPGLEVAGTVVDGDALAMDQAGFRIGDAVCALVAGGGYAELCVAPVGQCLPVPKNMSLVEAASLPETCFTVWSNVFERGQLRAGETLLVQGGASGIGVTAIQMAKALGANVIVTAGSEEKCAACLAFGADHAIHHRTQDFVQEIRTITGNKGVDVVLDMVAGDYVQRELECLAEDGRLVVIGLQGGTKAEIDMAGLMRRRLTVTGSTLRQRSVAFKAELAQALRRHVWPLLESGRMRAVIHSTFAVGRSAASGPSAAERAHRLMESNQHVGKIVLTWGT